MEQSPSCEPNSMLIKSINSLPCMEPECSLCVHKAHQQSLPWPRWIQSTLSSLISLISILILSSFYISQTIQCPKWILYQSEHKQAISSLFLNNTYIKLSFVLFNVAETWINMAQLVDRFNNEVQPFLLEHLSNMPNLGPTNIVTGVMIMILTVQYFSLFLSFVWWIIIPFTHALLVILGRNIMKNF
jgi:hypothetical protein